MKPIAISGYSLCNALGGTRDVIRAALQAGQSGLAPTTVDVPFSTWTGAIATPLPRLPDSLQPWETRTAQIAYLLLQQLEAPLAAMRQRWAPERIAIILGTSTAGADRTEEAYRHFVAQGHMPHEYDLWRHHTYGATLEVVRQLSGATGPAWMLSTACTSSAKPFGSAQRLIEAGVIDAAIVGGIDTLCSMTLQGFHALSALSLEKTRPFSKDRKGINIGEGGALMLLERDAEAVGWLAGVGESSDAYHLAAPHPQGEGAEAAMRRALASANLDASVVDYINAHGTGTGLNDSAESQAIARVFGTDVPVVSTKGYTGHTLGGAGATEAAFVLMALEEGWIPPSIGADPLDDTLTVRIPATMERGAYRYGLSNSFAFGGNNISLLFKAAGGL